MKNPKKYFEIYLKKLIDSLLYIMSLDEQLKLIKAWEVPRRVEALRIGSHFYSLVIHSFFNTILIEVNKLVSIDEDRSILDFLSKLEIHLNSVSPTRYDPRTRRRVVIQQKVYKAIIERHLRLFDERNHVIARIKGLRDKTIAHTDKKYFSNPQAILRKYRIENREIDQLLKTIAKVVRFHHSYLLESDLDIKVHSSGNVDSVLVYTRAYDRIWHDDNLNHIRKYIYKLDNYKQTTIK